MGDCLKRSFEAGFRWCGIEDDVPCICMSEDARELASQYGLNYIDGRDANFGNNPVLVIYRDNYDATNAEYHAVFVSDISPLKHHDIFSVIIGWEDLRRKTKQLNVTVGVNNA